MSKLWIRELEKKLDRAEKAIEVKESLGAYGNLGTRALEKRSIDKKR